MNYTVQLNILAIDHRFIGLGFSVLIIVRIISVVLLGYREFLLNIGVEDKSVRIYISEIKLTILFRASSDSTSTE